MSCAIVLFVWFLSSCLYGQIGNIRFKRISIEDGLSQSSVTCILQDRKGFMWFGTQDGLNRYDGYEFWIYIHNPDDLSSISDNYIWCIYEDRSGVLWIGTYGGGLNRFNPITGRFTHYKHKPANPNSLSHNDVRAIYEDRSGVMWIGTFGGGLNKFDQETGRFTKYRHIWDGPNSLSHDYISSIFEERSGILWIGTAGGGLNKFDQKNEQFILYKHNQDYINSLSSNNINCIYEDRYKCLWIGTEGGGLNRFDRKTGKFIHYTTENSNLSYNDINSIFEDSAGVLWIGTTGGGLNQFDRKTGSFINYTVYNSSMSHDDISAIYEDRSGVLWVGTFGGGVNKYDRSSSQFAHYKHEPASYNSLSHNDVMAIFEDSSGVLWIGTHGGGLNRFDRKTHKFLHYTIENSNLSHNDINSIFEDRSGILWIGTNGGGLNRLDRKAESFNHYMHSLENPNSLSHNGISSIYEDRYGMMWIGTHGGGLNKFDRKTLGFICFKHDFLNPISLSHNDVRVIYEDRFGILWIGTYGGGLNKLNRKRGIFNCYMHDYRDFRSLSADRIMVIYEDNSGVLWIGTSGGGLNKMVDREKGMFKSYREKDGLPNAVIYGILEDNKGNLWLSTNNGISRFNPRTEVFRNYDIYDGLQSNEFNTGAYFKIRTGEMFFGGINGFNAFFPQQIKENLYIPPVVITAFLISNRYVPLQSLYSGSSLQKPIHETDAITLSYNQNVFSFEFAALHYASPQKNRYKYKLEGWDEYWIETYSRNRRATYTNLPAGEYVFRVTGSNKDGIWNKRGTSIDLKIMPPPWKTWWAYILYILALAGIVYLPLFLWAQKKKRSYERSVAQRLKQLDRLKDEFLSNTSHELRTPLNGIIGLTESLIDGAVGPINEKFAANLLMISTSAKRLAHLVNDILDFSTLRNKSLELHKRPVDLYALTNVVLMLSKPLIGSKKLELINDIGPAAPAVEADENRLQQIMHNLVGNAIKFTESGIVNVSAGIEKDMIHVQVSDTGIGIPEEKHEKIFESFEQAEGSTARPYGGTGLGLAVTKQLVELHGGKIWVESTVGKGSTVTFTLPLSKKEAVKEEQETKSPGVEIPVFEIPQQGAVKDESDHYKAVLNSSDFHILVVDDDPINRQVIRNLLSIQNYNVTEVSSGHEAVQALESSTQIDLILLDIMMPRMSGYEVCEKIREQRHKHELPIIFLTAKTHPTDLVTAFKAGGNDFISKPVSKGELLSRVQTHLQLLQVHRNLSKKHQQLKDTQSQLIQSEKMASLGILVAGVAHELNNPAACIKLNAEYFSRVWKEIIPVLDQYAQTNEDFDITDLPYEKSKKEVEKLMNGLQEDSNRIQTIIEELTNFSRKEDSPGKQAVEINKVIQSAVNLTHNLVKKSIKHFSYELEKGLPLIYGSSRRLEQVFINLIRNACQALRDNTQGLHISTTYDKEKKQILVKVKDEGVGIEAENLECIMDPFFTTKTSGEGVGLGLSISFNIIQEHGGKINFESKPGKGTTVSVTLPVEPLPGEEK